MAIKQNKFDELDEKINKYVLEIRKRIINLESNFERTRAAADLTDKRVLENNQEIRIDTENVRSMETVVRNIERSVEMQYQAMKDKLETHLEEFQETRNAHEKYLQTLDLRIEELHSWKKNELPP